MNKGLLIIFSGPSGSGKDTVLTELVKEDPNLHLSISATTRPMRDGEVDNVDYYFLGREHFENLIADGGLLEYAEYCDNLYGTLREPVEKAREQGRDVILEIEVEGARKVKAACPDAVMIFILPPSMKELRRRLYKRGTDEDEVIEKRLAKAASEIHQAQMYDYLIVNDDLKQACEDVKTVIRAEKLKTKRQKSFMKEIENYA